MRVIRCRPQTRSFEAEVDAWELHLGDFPEELVFVEGDKFEGVEHYREKMLVEMNQLFQTQEPGFVEIVQLDLMVVILQQVLMNPSRFVALTSLNHWVRQVFLD